MTVDPDHLAGPEPAHAPMVIPTHSPEETQAAGAVLATCLRPGDVISLAGDLGAGKTCLVQGIAQGLGIDEPLTSPSFVLRKDYTGTSATGEPIHLAHIDIYRLDTLHDLDVLGLDDTPDAITIIEWGDAASPALPEDRLDIRIDVPLSGEGDDTQRTITLVPQGPHWPDRINHDWMT